VRRPSVRLPKLRWARGHGAAAPTLEEDHEQKTIADRIVARLRRDIPLLVLDVAIVFVAYLITLVIRFEGTVPALYWRNFLAFLPVAVVVHLIANSVFGLYGQMWRYASVHEARRLIFASAVGGLAATVSGTMMAGEIRPLPLSVLTLGSTVALIGFGAIRFQSRLFGFRRRTADTEPIRVLVVGAGDAGSMILKDIASNPSLGLQAVGLIDDDPRKLNRSLGDVRVLGPRSEIPALVDSLNVDQVLLAMPSATSEVVRDVAAQCERAQAMLRVLPSVREKVGGSIGARDIRDLRIEDLIGRQQIETDLEAVRGILASQRVLVTGAGGSIGAEIVRQVQSFGPAALVLVDNDETHLHDLYTDVSDAGVEMVLADVRDRDRILEIFVAHRPEIVFHAAAHKHVPVLERYPQEALHTNIIGTANVADAAFVTSVERFVLISTDKAIRPQSVMGASKWFAEQIVRTLQGGECMFCAVRFGNVLGSRGSVIPTFLRQIAHGGPVTVTHEAMTRYFMSVQEAVQLVLQAAALSKGGEVFTLDMGEPVTIVDLAKGLIRLSGRIPHRDIDIVFTGARAGEKLTEDVVDPLEETLPSIHPSILASRPPASDRAAIRRALGRLEALASDGRIEELAEALKLLAGQPLESTRAEAVL
jgi:FlaA1/EpsC-like NDP-sugar epimerase